MTGRLRYVLAAAFVALFLVIPAADDGRIALLQTRAWLRDEAILAALLEIHGDVEPEPAGYGDLPASHRRVPPILVELRPAVDDADAAEAYARIMREVARSNGLEVDATLRPLLLEVRQGDNGFRSTLAWTRDRELVPIAQFELLKSPGEDVEQEAYYPDRWSLLAAFLAIALAIVTGKVIPSLLLGCLAGAVLWAGGPFAGAWHLAAGTIWSKVLTDQFSVEIMGFVVFLFMTIGVMTRSGGIKGMVEWVRKFARGPISTQVCTYVIGLLIFFDDYSNCIITGTTMRPLTDRNRIAREKLAYIVDSTAAPVAGISIFSTWVAYEVSMFAPQLPEVTKADGTPYQLGDGFSVFLQTLPFRFYCVFTLIMVILTIIMRREYGPMLTAARRAYAEGKPIADDAQPLVAEGLAKTEPPEGTPNRGLNALLPIVLLIALTVVLIFSFGSSALSDADRQKPLWQRIPTILGNGESQRALCYSSCAALLLAIALAVLQRILTFKEAVMSAVRSARSLMFAVVILILAWSIGNVCQDLGTAQFLTASIHGSFSAWMLPIIMFLLSSLVAFSTGTSYGTMAILLPNVVVLAHSMGQSVPELGGPALMMLTIGAVLEGSIFGDHCSPISDTTVLTSVATGSDHLHHVRTQAPYAVTVMLIAVVCGYLPAALLGPDIWPLAWLAGGGAIALVLIAAGRDPTKAQAQ